MYATPANLLARYQAKELAELADPSGLIDADLITKAINGDDLSAQSAEVQNAANTALAVLNRAGTDAGAGVDASLQAAGYTLPLTHSVDFVSNLACDLARYNLYDSGALEDNSVVIRRHKDAQRFLDEIRKGAFRLGLAENPAPTALGSPQVAAGTKVFNDDLLGDY